MTDEINSGGFWLFPDQENEFKEYDCIFIHIPRTGGRSIHYRLRRNCTGQHKSIKEYIDQLTEPVVKSKFKFAVIRNPWERALALWNLYVFGGMSIPSIQTPIPHFDDWIQELHQLKQSFPTNLPYDLETLNYCRNYDGEILIDEFLRFENLENDFEKKVVPKLNLDKVPFQTFGKGTKPTNNEEARKMMEKVLDRQIDHHVMTVEEKNKIMDDMPYVSTDYHEMFKKKESKNIVSQYNQELIWDFGYRF